MNRRRFLASVTSLSAGAALLPEALAQTAPQITHVDAKTDGAQIKSSVVKLDTIKAEGSAPGAKAYVNFNGPTKQLAALVSGSVTLEPGAEPHPPHSHAEEEVMMISEGTGEFFLEGVGTKVKAGDMVYAEANVLHGVKNTGKTRMVFYFIKTMAKSS